MKFLKTISALAASVLMVSAMPVSAADQYQEMRDEVVMIVNEQRTAHRKGEVYEAELLNQAAQIRAEEIADKFSHTRPDGREPQTAFTDLGGTYFVLGENVAFGFSDEEDVMNGWMNSEGHRANILNSMYNAVGVGIYVKSGVIYWVQMFSDGTGLTSLYSKGDVNGDQIINALDAAETLKDAAEMGAGGSGIFSRLQRSYADMDGNGAVNATDASIILNYAAYVGAGGTADLKAFGN